MSKAVVLQELHNDFGVTFSEAEKTYNIAVEYIRLRSAIGDHPEKYKPSEYVLVKASSQPEVTNEEIRFSLKQLRVYLIIKIRDGKEGGVPVELLKRVEEIQEYFENVPSAQQEPIKLHVDHALTEEEIKNLKQKIADSPIVLMPSAQPRKGEWSKEMIGATPYKYRCSKCNKYSRAMYDFCPNCGADTRGEKDDKS